MTDFVNDGYSFKKLVEVFHIQSRWQLFKIENMYICVDLHVDIHGSFVFVNRHITSKLPNLALQTPDPPTPHSLPESIDLHSLIYMHCYFMC